jgi:hypothetical protein
MSTEIEGRWDDLVSRPELRGHQVRVTILDETPTAPPSDDWLDSLREMARNGLPYTGPIDDSRESIYEGRE